ncbi:hypothetical protein FNF28_00747 [Cafeteria roenbergensis]|uniref:Uncharacterized protein n=1 Tax=Cafeteria roenbergensis TaxID=33653 RepID=A0A5A8E3Y4_CAFRO|nr:hypothetical protein FNF28_00747 [Cafeteria roenbergensis]
MDTTVAGIGRATSRELRTTFPSLAARTLRTPQRVTGATILPRRAASDHANAFEQFWSGLVPSRDRLTSPGPGQYAGVVDGMAATSSHARSPVLRMPPRLPVAQLSMRLVQPPKDTTPGVGSYDVDDGIGGRKWKAQLGRPGGGYPSSRSADIDRIGRFGSQAAQARMRESRAAEADALRGGARPTVSALSMGSPRDPSMPRPHSVAIGTEGMNYSEGPGLLGYRAGWVTGSLHKRELPASTAGPGSYDILRALGLHKRRVFRAWAAWVKHKRLLWATTVFKARLRPIVRRFRVASRMRKAAIIASFLDSVQRTNNAVRAARIFHARILRMQAVVDSIDQTERFLESTEEAVRSLGVIRRARRGSTVFSPDAVMALGPGGEALAAGVLPGSGPEDLEEQEAAKAPRTAGMFGPASALDKPDVPASQVDEEAEERRRRALFRASGDEDTQWETILAKLLTQQVPEGVEAEARAELSREGSKAATPGRGATGGKSAREAAAAARAEAMASAAASADRRMQRVVADLPTSTKASAGDSPPDDLARERRLSIEMAVMRVRTLEEWPPIPDTELGAMLTTVLRRRRNDHSKAMAWYRERLRDWQLGFDAEARKAEARVASIRNRRITKAERIAIGEYLKARRPNAPRFYVLEPWESMLDLAKRAMVEQRNRNENPEPAQR